jgi:hypothetical protein
MTLKHAGPPVVVRDWHDIYCLDPAAAIECPDCEQRSAELDNLYALARWVADHDCPV